MKIPKQYQPAAFFVAMLLTFDVAYSLLSTCQPPIYQSAAQQSGNQNHCTPFGSLFFVLGVRPLVHFLHTYEHELVAGFTIVLAFSTVALWLSTHKLWEATRDTAAKQEEDTRILQRAYVSVEPMGLSLLIDGAHILGLVSIKNAGNLPARNLSWFINVTASQNAEEETFWLEETKGNIVVAPHSETTRGSDRRFMLQMLLNAAGADRGSRIEEDAIFIYVSGVVRYHDGFTDGRFTKFCHRYNYKVRPQVAGAGQYSMSRELARLHTHGNESD